MCETLQVAENEDIVGEHRAGQHEAGVQVYRAVVIIVLQFFGAQDFRFVAQPKWSSAPSEWQLRLPEQ